MSPQTDVSQAMFPWYRLVPGDSPLEQGDIFVKFPVVVPSTSISDIVGQPDEIVEVSGLVERFDVIVVTQSCDFAKMKDADDVILCPRNDYFEVVKMRPN